MGVNQTAARAVPAALAASFLWSAAAAASSAPAPPPEPPVVSTSTAHPGRLGSLAPFLARERFQGIPWRLSGSLSLNWRNVGPEEPAFETQIQDQVYLADMFFAFHGPALEGIPFWLEFQMPTGAGGQPNLYQFYFSWDKFERWDIRLGKFLVPYGGYNELYRPDMFLTVTRPLLYASPDSLDLVVRLNSPRPPVSSGYSDLGGRASFFPKDDRWFVPNELTAFVVNGLGEATNRSRTFPRPDNLGIPQPPANGVSIDFGNENHNLADNNNNKAIGGRVVFALGNLDLPWPIPEGSRELNGFNLGFSGMGGQYDLEAANAYRYLGVDMAFEYKGLSVTGEYAHSFTHFKSPLMASSSTIVSPTQFVRDFEIIQGYFVQMAYPIARRPWWGERITGVLQFSQLFRRGPRLELLLDQTVNGVLFNTIAAYRDSNGRTDTRMDKYTIAVNWRLTKNLSSKVDFSYWLMGRSTNLASTDIYQSAISFILGF